MIAYCTYCSAQKKHSQTPLPAIQLYKSERITQVSAIAKAENAHFFILSGKYGLLESDQNIPFYDHLLTANEVELHATLITSQLKEKNINQIIFYMGSIQQDKNIEPYLDCMQMACNKANISIKINEANFTD